MSLVDRMDLTVPVFTGAIALITILLAVAAVARRLQRDRRLRRVDDLRNRYQPLLVALLEGELDYAQGLAALERISGPARVRMLEQLLLQKEPKPEQVPTLRRLCEDLGLTKVWQADLRGQRTARKVLEAPRREEGGIERIKPLRFLARARAAENLGLIRHRPSWPLLVRALHDPHPDVQWVATRALGTIREPAAFPALADRLRSFVLGTSTSLSVETTKAALINFPLQCAADVAPLLRHPHPRVRFEATDVIRQMAEREAAADPDFLLCPRNFFSSLAEHFLTTLGYDSDPEVRARAAPVIAYLAGPRSAAVLMKLLGDETWFVRLHAVRALAKPRFEFMASRVARLLTDSQWRVREAATETLIKLEVSGMRELIAHFFGDGKPGEADGNGHGRSWLPDLYSREQIAEQMERAGLLPALALHFEAWERRDGASAISQLIRAGKGPYLLAVLDALRAQAASEPVSIPAGINQVALEK